jgi:hypothetical protein
MRPTSLPPTLQLARSLREVGYTSAATIGGLLNPQNRYNARQKAGQRILDGTHAPTLDTLAELARTTGLTITVGPDGVTVTTVA